MLTDGKVFYKGALISILSSMLGVFLLGSLTSIGLALFGIVAGAEALRTIHQHKQYATGTSVAMIGILVGVATLLVQLFLFLA